MIFVSGIHGVGKSFFCKKVRDLIGHNFYSASSLIAQQKNRGFEKDKLISNIDDNQHYLLRALENLSEVESCYFLDGHFCLLNTEGEVQRVPLVTFVNIKPTAIILLTEDPEIIAQRRFERDGVRQDIMQIECFQEQESQYAKEVAAHLKIPLFISRGALDIDKAIDFAKEMERP